MTESRWNGRDMNEYLKDRSDRNENESMNVYDHRKKESKEPILNYKRDSGHARESMQVALDFVVRPNVHTIRYAYS